MSQIPSDWEGRAEDPDLLTGRAAFTGDIRLPSMVEAIFIRSPYAHADILSIDATRALEAGALAFFAAKDLPFIHRHLITRYWHPAIRGGLPPLLAIDRVRYVGEPVAIVVAKDRYQAEDLAALVEVDYRELPVIASTERAAEPDSAALHEDWPGNIAAELENVVGDAAEAINAAPHRIRERFTFARQTPLPLETRGCVADFRSDGSITVWSSTQVHYNVRNNIAEILDIPEDKVRVVAEHVGGGFGSKSRPYAEEVLISHTSRALGLPVRWIEDRLENLQATTQSRGTESEIEVGFDPSGRVSALRGTLIVDVGAYIFTSGIVTAMTASGMCAGPYRIENIDLKVRCVGTNRTPLATYRGAGQPEATFPLERLMDRVADVVGLSPLEVRLRNIVHPKHMPHQPSIPFAGPDAAFDSGDYPAILRQAASMADLTAPPARSRNGGYACWGLACGIEVTGFITGEEARAQLNADGTVSVWTGMTSQGQGQRTTYAKVCADILGVDWKKVSVHLGDTDLVTLGRGAFASRGAVIGANAVAGAAARLKEKICELGATLLQTAPGELICTDGAVKHPDSDQAIDIAEIARANLAELGDVKADQLTAQFVYDAPGSMTFAFSAHAAHVFLEPETGSIRVLDYVVAHDSGRPLDTVIVDGQIAGGIVDGIGGALFAEVHFDDQAQPLSGTLADYLTIGSVEAPTIRSAHLNTPAETNPLGVRGVGEGGVLPVAPAIANALAKINTHVPIFSENALNAIPITTRSLSQDSLANEHQK